MVTTSDQIVIVKTMVNTPKVAKQIAKQVVRQKLAACGQVIPRVTSYYWWEGKLCCTPEYMVLLKTTTSKYPEVEKAIKQLHSYQCPEIACIPITAGNRDWLAWVQHEVE